jgi:hypothetical protein
MQLLAAASAQETQTQPEKNAGATTGRNSGDGRVFMASVEMCVAEWKIEQKKLDTLIMKKERVKTGRQQQRDKLFNRDF